MKQRWLIPLGVFVVGFGLGYGLTWIFVGSPGDAPGDEPVQPAAALPDAPPTSPGTGPAVDVPEPAPAESDVPILAEGDVPTAPAAQPDVAVTPEPDVPPAALPDTGPTEAPEPAAEPTWWDRCRGKRCRVDFGGITGTISLRGGRIEHGSVVDWRENFGRAKRIGFLTSERSVIVEVVSVGLGPDGKPTAAQVIHQAGGRRLEGIIALQIGGKRITMKPVDQD